MTDVPAHVIRWKTSLIASALAALGASLCCVAPLVLLALGIGGAWVTYLTALEPYRPIFVGLTLAFLALAFRRLHLRRRACTSDKTCADDRVVRRQRFIFWVVAAVLLALLAAPWLGSLFY